MGVQHIIDERPLEARSQPGQHRKAGFRHAHGPIKVQNSKRFSEIPVRLGRSGEGGRRAPSTHLNIVVGILPGRYRLVRKVGDAESDMSQLFFYKPKLIFLSFDGVAQRFHCCHGRVGRLLLTFQASDLVRTFFELMPKFFHLDHSGAAILGQFPKILPCDIFTAWPEPLAKSV